jgi:valyl-tRNA synthetase
MQGADEGKKKLAQEALYTALEGGLRLLHPMMPFVTEELWQRLPRRSTDSVPSIMLAPYPTAEWCSCRCAP